MSNSAPLATLLKNRSSLLQILVAAVLLALGINLLSSALAEWLTNKWALWMVSLALVGLSAFIIGRQTMPSRHIRRKMNGLFIMRPASNELVAIPRYDYSEQLRSYFRGLFAENLAPKRLWDSDPLHGSFEFDAKLARATIRQTEAGQLIVEATEYYVLETLSTHLTDFFGQSGISSEHVQELSRDDIPDIVLKNRFLDTFSRPMRDRASFVDENFDGSKVDGVVAAFGANGTRYSSFDLTLPVGATGTRRSPSTIVIETPKFKLVISIEFRGFNANLPYKFKELYLAELSSTEIKSYDISLSTSIEFSRLSLLSRSGWDYHAWLDSFLEELEKGFSVESFLVAINWETAATVARTVQQELQSKNVRVPPAQSVVIDDWR